MKRFHVHLHVDDLTRSVDFYSKLFAAPPVRVESDYAKWMLDDPAVNFAISTRGQGHVGLDHLGIQVDQEVDLVALKAQVQAADLSLIDEGATTCCYARSDKHWVVDPQGVAWEHFQTLGQIAVFREESPEAGAAVCCTPTESASEAARSGCCSPATETRQTSHGKPIGLPVRASGSCC